MPGEVTLAKRNRSTARKKLFYQPRAKGQGSHPRLLRPYHGGPEKGGSVSFVSPGIWPQNSVNQLILLESVTASAQNLTGP
jgi:hypothetical protein